MRDGRECSAVDIFGTRNFDKEVAKLMNSWFVKTSFVCPLRRGLEVDSSEIGSLLMGGTASPQQSDTKFKPCEALLAVSRSALEQQHPDQTS